MKHYTLRIQKGHNGDGYNVTYERGGAGNSDVSYLNELDAATLLELDALLALECVSGVIVQQRGLCHVGVVYSINGRVQTLSVTCLLAYIGLQWCRQYIQDENEKRCPSD